MSCNVLTNAADSSRQAKSLQAVFVAAGWTFVEIPSGKASIGISPGFETLFVNIHGSSFALTRT